MVTTAQWPNLVWLSSFSQKSEWVHREYKCEWRLTTAFKVYVFMVFFFYQMIQYLKILKNSLAVWGGKNNSD